MLRYGLQIFFVVLLVRGVHSVQHFFERGIHFFQAGFRLFCTDLRRFLAGRRFFPLALHCF
jgi:hypothetical protein